MDDEENVLKVEEQMPVDKMPPELTITVGQRTSVTFGVEDVRSLVGSLTKFLDKHSGPEGGGK